MGRREAESAEMAMPISQGCRLAAEAASPPADVCRRARAGRCTAAKRFSGQWGAAGQHAALAAVEEEVGHAQGQQPPGADVQGIALADAAQADPHARPAEADGLPRGVKLEQMAADPRPRLGQLRFGGDFAGPPRKSPRLPERRRRDVVGPAGLLVQPGRQLEQLEQPRLERDRSLGRRPVDPGDQALGPEEGQLLLDRLDRAERFQGEAGPVGASPGGKTDLELASHRPARDVDQQVVILSAHAVQPAHPSQRAASSSKQSTRGEILHYSRLMASTGHTSTHAPQSPHVSASTTARPSFMAIASNGQDSTHVSQPVHFSGSTTAAIEYLHKTGWNQPRMSVYSISTRKPGQEHKRAAITALARPVAAHMSRPEFVLGDVCARGGRDMLPYYNSRRNSVYPPIEGGGGGNDEVRMAE